MKTLISTVAGVVGILFLAASVYANPGMIPKHPGYPAGGKSPVTGQSLANDSGQTNAVGAKASMAAAGAGAAHTKQNVGQSNNARLKKSGGAGVLPQVDGPNMFSDKHVIKSGTKMK